MLKRVEPLSDKEVERFVTEYPQRRCVIRNQGIRRLVLAIACMVIHLMFQIQSAFAGRLLELFILFFLIGMIKSFVQMLLLDRIHRHFKAEY